MMFSQTFLLLFLCATLTLVNGVPVDSSDHSSEATFKEDKEKVEVQVYYECFCPWCVKEYKEFIPLVKKLGPHINFQTYPYGNARMHTENGTTVVECQHGEAECYGNKLHACAIDILKDVLTYVTLNACVISRQSNDPAVEECAKIQGVDPQPIIDCASGSKGEALLIHYGKESQKIKYPGVPWVLVNGTPLSCSTKKTLIEAVCDAFKHPPEECKNVSNA